MNIRFRMMLLAVFSILPSIFFIFYLNSNEKSFREKQQIENLTNLTRLYSEEHYQVVENARHLLLALSVTPQLQTKNITECNKFLSSLVSTYARYSNFGVTDNNGNIICSAVTTDKKTNLSDTLFFKDAKKTNSFAIGEYRISTVTNNPVLSFGYPTATGVIYSSVDLDWLNKLTETLSTNENISTTVLDKSGNILSQNSGQDNPPDELFPKEELLKMMTNNTEGLIDNVNLNGVKKTYAFKKMGEQTNSPFVVLGATNENILEETRILIFRRVILSILITVLSLVFAWWAGGILIVKQVEELKKIDVLKDDFISLVSHQIRTPLTSIRWLSEIMLTQKQYDLTRKSKNITKDIYEVSGSVINLVGTFLNISKIESGKIKLQLENVDVKKLINEVLVELRVNIKNKNAKIITKVSKKINTIKADRKLLKQAYINLISNAIKYSKSKGIITVSVYKSDTFVITEVKDNGIGILAEDKDKIFQKFFRTRSATEHNPDGSGLGAYLVKIIVEAHGGKIWFNSKKNKGTTFYISLPVN